jgi:SSS family solute:Na+ symporter
VIFFMPTKFALDLQLLGGVWMIQIFPAIVFGLYTRWFSGTALLGGWIVGFVLGTYLSWGPTAWTPTFALAPGWGAYNGIIAVVANIAVAVVLSLVLKPAKSADIVASDFADTVKA